MRFCCTTTLRVFLRMLLVTLVAAAAAMAGSSAQAGADAPSAAGNESLHEVLRDGRYSEYTFESPSMEATMSLRVLRAKSPGRPTLYLLNGAAGGFGGSNWFDQTDIRSFFADEDVNIVVPMGGAASYFTDWRADDPKLGRQKWTTYLTKELPPAVDSTLNANGVNGIAGISMAGSSVFTLSMQAPTLYRALGSFSGCMQTSDPVGQAFVRLVVEGRGGGNTVNMWGPPNDPAWRENDPTLHPDDFRGKSIYVSAGSGAAGKYENLNGPGIDGNLALLAAQIGTGAVIETATNYCSRNFERVLGEAHIPATFHFYSQGTHSWGYWRDELHNAWPQFKAALGA